MTKEKWIDVKTKVPKDDQMVLVFNARLQGCPVCAWYDEAMGFFPHGCPLNLTMEVTHWMEIPNTPKKK
jgi:hypothetical protein